MSARDDLLIEVGTEELPPATLLELGAALAERLGAALAQRGLDWDEPGARWFATPRRLAVLLPGLLKQQPDREEQRLGPAVAAAFDGDGEPTKAARGFARSVGVEVARLTTIDTPRGPRLGYVRRVAGAATAALLPELLSDALKALPVARAMRWGDRAESFVRPVHWIVALLGDAVVPGELLGCAFGADSRGHRFHHPDPVPIARPAAYAQALRAARVLVDPDERRSLIRAEVKRLAAQAGGRARIEGALVDEIVALTEWPVALIGGFDPAFLEVPAEALISTMEHHQKFFPLTDADGALMAHFIAVANLESTAPDVVAAGFERVLRPRLADARFFWQQDLKRPLAELRPTLDQMIYQQQLGSIGDKIERVRRLGAGIADELEVDPGVVDRAALLCKCDLLTEMVGEFPELQGIMGRHYAAAQGEDAAVATAIEEHYLPRFAGDRIAAGPAGRVVALADRIDTLCGIFGAGLKPTGNRDPFALRRAALGLIRTMIEGGIDGDLERWLAAGLEPIEARIPGAAACLAEVFEFVMDRLRAYYAEAGIGGDVFEAVWSRRPTRPLDFHQRVLGLKAFQALDSAQALAAANKRIGNILRKSEDPPAPEVAPDLLTEPEEAALHRALGEVATSARPLLERRDYAAVLTRLAALGPTVDRFFDAVLVMAEEAAVRRNRLAILAEVKGIFDEVADISKLVVETT